MKHLFLAVIATGLIFATSCKKEEVPETNSGIKSNNTIMDFNSRAADKEKVNDVFNTIETGDQDAIITSFENNHKMLLNYLPKQAVDGVIDKTYTVKSRGKELADKGRFMLFYNGEGTRVYVRPFFAI